MRLLADENIPLETVRALRAAGHDVFSASESLPGASDESLLSRANDEVRLVVTFDRDFGELVARRRKESVGGILLLRFAPGGASDVTTLLLSLFAEAGIEWTRRISVADRSTIRQRRL